MNQTVKTWEEVVEALMNGYPVEEYKIERSDRNSPGRNRRTNQRPSD